MTGAGARAAALAAVAWAAALTCVAAAPGGYGQTRDSVMAVIEETAARGRTLTGQQVNEYEVFIECTSFERIHELTGTWPAILGLELMFMIENPSYRGHFMKRLEEHAARGGLIALTWHARNPLEVCPRGEFYECTRQPMTDAGLERLLDPSTREHALWRADVDVIAGVLESLQAMGVAPLFRPYHEMNGDWFWWGNKRAFAGLWRALHDRLEKHHGLDNLVWVFAADNESAEAARYWPGKAYVDFTGADLYAGERSAGTYEAARRNVTALGDSRVFAFTEIGLLPTMEVFRRVSPAWFLLWGGEFIDRRWSPRPCERCNRAADVAAIYGLEEVLTLDELEWPRRPGRQVSLAARHEPPQRSCPARLL